MLPVNPELIVDTFVWIRVSAVLIPVLCKSIPLVYANNLMEWLYFTVS